MLFLLTGELQTGKTRWLEALVDRLADEGVGSYGVVAPGVWVPSDSSEASGQRLEKLAIDNVLLPERDVVPFARRRDLAMRDGELREGRQAEKLGLGWCIFDEAISKVNDHFEKIGRSRASLAGDAADCAAASGTSAADETNGGAGASPGRPSLLVVDELGPLELMHGGGLTSAARLLDEGPSEAFPHAIAVVRKSLLPLAQERFAKTWPELLAVEPTEHSERELLSAFGLS